MATTTKSNGKMSTAEFVTAAIPALRNLDKSKGIHSAVSGLFAAMREYYGWPTPHKGDDYNLDPCNLAIKDLADKKVIQVNPVRGKNGAPGGLMVYLFGEAPPRTDGHQALGKILAARK